MSELSQVLDQVGDIASGMSKIPGPAGIAGSVAAIALRAASAIAQAGKDPVVEIARMLRASPEVASVHSEWERLIDTSFNKKSEPPAAGDGSDVYGDPDDGNDKDQPP